MKGNVSWPSRAAAWMACVCGLAGGLAAKPSTAEAQLVLARRVDLKVLVLSAQDTGTAMIKAGLDEGMVPYTEIDLTKCRSPADHRQLLGGHGVVVHSPRQVPSGGAAERSTHAAVGGREDRARQVRARVQDPPARRLRVSLARPSA